LFASLVNRLIGSEFACGRVLLLGGWSGFAFHGWSDGAHSISGRSRPGRLHARPLALKEHYFMITDVLR